MDAFLSYRVQSIIVCCTILIVLWPSFRKQILDCKSLVSDVKIGQSMFTSYHSFPALESPSYDLCALYLQAL